MSSPPNLGNSLKVTVCATLSEIGQSLGNSVGLCESLKEEKQNKKTLKHTSQVFLYLGVNKRLQEGL